MTNGAPDFAQRQSIPSVPAAQPRHAANIGSVRDVMTTDVLAIAADDTLDIVAGLFEKYDYDGMPVVDAGYKLLGVITAYDMVLQSSGMHLPTVIGIMENIAKGKGDRRQLDEQFGKLKEISATSIMNTKPLTVGPDAPLSDAAGLFAQHPKVNPLCVVDAQGKLVGVISRYDILKFFNEKYFNKVVQDVNEGDPFKAFPTRSARKAEEALGEVEKEFLLVTKRRPLIWKYVAIAMFAAGLIVATALIIRIVQRGG
ncbi:MAG TPA: CBS domain-containing protein [Candidatus Paceibacterota bacterium]|nr:CBS domain-containing protein [Candidatus Paceibacterota bacterium]